MSDVEIAKEQAEEADRKQREQAVEDERKRREQEKGTPQWASAKFRSIMSSIEERMPTTQSSPEEARQYVRRVIQTQKELRQLKKECNLAVKQHKDNPLRAADNAHLKQLVEGCA